MLASSEVCGSLPRCVLRLHSGTSSYVWHMCNRLKALSIAMTLCIINPSGLHRRHATYDIANRNTPAIRSRLFDLNCRSPSLSFQSVHSVKYKRYNPVGIINGNWWGRNMSFSTSVSSDLRVAKMFKCKIRRSVSWDSCTGRSRTARARKSTKLARTIYCRYDVKQSWSQLACDTARPAQWTPMYVSDN